MDALKASHSVTSVDLSSNSIGDEGVQAIVGVLGVNGAPELIDLDLRGNRFSDAAMTQLVRRQDRPRCCHLPWLAWGPGQARAEAMTSGGGGAAEGRAGRGENF